MGPLDHLTPWVGERETEASLRREADREWEEDRERRTAEHGPKEGRDEAE